MKTNKVLIVLVIVLVIVNVGTISFLWFGKHSKKSSERRLKQPQVERYLKKRLKLSNEQVELFTKARESHFSRSTELMKEIRDYRKQLLRIEDDSVAANTIFRNLTDAHNKFERLTYHHFGELRSYCTESQQKAFDSVMITMFEHQSNRYPRRHRKKRHKKSE